MYVIFYITYISHIYIKGTSFLIIVFQLKLIDKRITYQGVTTFISAFYWFQMVLFWYYNKNNKLDIS